MSGWDGFTVFGLDKKRVGGWGGGDGRVRIVRTRGHKSERIARLNICVFLSVKWSYSICTVERANRRLFLRPSL